MAIRKKAFALGEYYHIYNRGNSKQNIFHDSEDYFRFMTLLYTCNSVHNFRMSLVNDTQKKDPFLFERGGEKVALGAYCLMPNHFHLLVKETIEGGVSVFMQKLSTAYAMYYNKKYKRTGALFEGKFKAQHLDTDVYLKYIFSYIHLNPLKLLQKDWKENGIKNKEEGLKYLSQYEYSSYKEYVGQPRKYSPLLERGAYPEYFQNEKVFEHEIITWITHIPARQGLAGM